MNATPQLPGYELDQRLLEHPLAEIWRGRSFTGMEVVALVLSESAAADEEVRGRLSRVSRAAALDPAEQQTPLWAANFTADRPYAVTQLVRGQSGAERLLDPLDGLLGNDEESLSSVRSQLAQYGALPIPGAARGTAGPGGGVGAGSGGSGDGKAGLMAGPDIGSRGQSRGVAVPGIGLDAGSGAQPSYGGGTAGTAAGGGAGTTAGGGAGATAGGGAGAVAGRGAAAAGELDDVAGSWIRWGKVVGVVVAVLVVFSALYSVGSAVASKTKAHRPAEAAPGTLVSPAGLPSPVLQPGIVKPKPADYIPATTAVGLVGAAYQRGADVQQVTGLGLPFVFGWPRPPKATDVGLSPTTVYRRVVTEQSNGAVILSAQFALRPCTTLAACLADRTAFDAEWTAALKAPVPATAKDGRTWLTVQDGTPYRLSMTHAFTSNGRSWLVGVAVSAVRGEEQSAQLVLNDIWRQTQ